MPEIRTSHTLQAPAARVWALLEDFGAIVRWWPKDAPIRIASVTLDGDGLGMVRHILNEGASRPIDERLDFLDRRGYRRRGRRPGRRHVPHELPRALHDRADAR